MLQGVLADVSIATGYVTIALMLGGRFVFQYFGWQVCGPTRSCICHCWLDLACSCNMARV